MSLKPNCTIPEGGGGGEAGEVNIKDKMKKDEEH